jgi:hypothetical protein
VREHPDVYPLLRRGKGGWLIGMTNLRDDPWKRVVIDLAVDGRAPKKASVLDARGAWKAVRVKVEPVDQGRVRVTLPGVPVMIPMAVWRLEV